MRIIDSIGRDYYDSVQSFAHDETIVYKRKEEDLSSDESLIKKMSVLIEHLYDDSFQCIHEYSFIKKDEDGNDRKLYHRIKIESQYIIFCGRVYQFLYCDGEFFYDIESFEHFIFPLLTESQKDRYLKSKRGVNSRYFSRSVLNRDSVLQFFIPVHEAYNTLIRDIHFYSKSPIIKVSDVQKSMMRVYNKKKSNVYNCTIFKDTNLKSCKFFKVVDPYKAYQDLDMFISGVMGGTCPPMIQISDKIKIEKHGFDSTTSFRNMKRDE